MCSNIFRSMIICSHNGETMTLKNFNVKERIFLLYMYFFTLVTTIAVVINILIGLDFHFNYKWIAVAVLSILLSVFARKRIHVKAVHRIGIYTICFILLPMCWIYSSGLLSPAMLYTPLLFLLINYLTRKKERVLLNIGLIIEVLVLIWLYYNKNEIFKTITPKLQFYDWMCHSPFILGFFSLLLTTFENAYEDERLKNKKREGLLQKLATTDHLTGLSNRNDMEQKLTLIHSIWERGIGKYSIILLDIDFFKAYNDLYGHVEGDKCLKEFGKILKLQLRRGTDWAFRYGGEEFLILLGITDSDGAIHIAEKIQKAVYKANIPHEESKVSYRVSASMGIATISEKDEHPSDLLRRADNALYNAKATGRNKISVD